MVVRYFARRILFFLLTLWAAVTLNFLIPRLQPGDPADAMVRKLVGQSRQIDPAQVKAIQAMLGTPNTGLLQQYVDYLKSLLHLDFGVSYTYFPYSVAHMVGQALWWTVILVGVTQVIGFVAGTLLGAFAAWRRNSVFDAVVSLGLSFVGTLPFFWIAMLLLYLFAFQWHVLPSGGGYSETSTRQMSWGYVGDILNHSILPATAILITAPIGWVMGMRNNMVQTLGEDYTRLALAKGLKPWKVALLLQRPQRHLAQRHGLRHLFGRHPRRHRVHRRHLQLPRPGPPAVRSCRQPRLPADASTLPVRHRGRAGGQPAGGHALRCVGPARAERRDGINGDERR